MMKHSTECSHMPCAGLRDEAEVSQEDSPLLLDLISATFPEVAESSIESLIQKKAGRKYV
jgi:hypothetical protein